jgi:hypothetical protein
MVKHQPKFDEAMNRAEADFRLADGKDMKDKCPYIFSSEMSDAYWITAFSLYHTGKKPAMLHKSTGHTWVVDMPVVSIGRYTVDFPSQRNGITKVV